MAKLPMKASEPNVNERAKFCGRTVISVIPTVNAKKKKSADRTRSAQKTCDM